MPLFTSETKQNRRQHRSSAVTIRLHTAAPTNASPTTGRTTVGGTGYENGISVAAGDWSVASNGDVENNDDIEFGTADDDVGTVTHWSAYRGATPVGFGTLPSTVIANGDTFTINANSLDINGAST